MSRLVDLNLKDQQTGKINASTIFTIVILAAFVACLVVGITSPSTGICGYIGLVCMSLGICLLGILFLGMLIGAAIEPHSNASADNASATPTGPGGCLGKVFLAAIAVFCIAMGLALGHQAILDVPYLADPPSIYLQNARCEVEHTTDDDGDPVTSYYLRGTDETGKRYSIPVGEDLFGKITGGSVRVKYLPNTNIAMDVKYQ